MVEAAEEAYQPMGDMRAALEIAFEAFTEQDERLHQLSNKYLCDRIKELEHNQCTCKTKRIPYKGKIS